MESSLWLVALLAAVVSAPPVQAHGDNKHDAGPAVFEQTAWGIAAKPADARRTIAVDMTDAMRFTPDTITVQEGETVRFVVRNRGRMRHEMVIGTTEELAKHAAMMAKFPNMEHDEPYMVHVDPGKSRKIVWTFNRAGECEFACLIAGHCEAGMRGTITVTPKQGDAK